MSFNLGGEKFEPRSIDGLPTEAMGAGRPASSPSPLQTSSTVLTSSSPPPVPVRPASLSSSVMSVSPYAATPSPYSSLSTYSPYSRFGSTYPPYGNTLYGGSPGHGGMGGYGYNGYGMNTMYGGMSARPGMDPNNPSLTQTLEVTTQHTSLLHSVVQTFTGVAQMLESTFMATHSSFCAMVGVIEQFHHLRNALGSVLGLFGLVRWMKELVGGKSSQMQGEFEDFLNGRSVRGPSGLSAPKPSKKALIIFFLAIVGVPYAMTRLIKLLNERVQQQQGQVNSLDPSALSFARALYPFTPSSPYELALKENEIVAIMGKLDPTTGMEVDPRLEVESEWWRGRTREGREGWFPRKWLEILERRKGEPKKFD